MVLAQPSGEIDPAQERYLLVRWHSVEQANDARNGESPFLHAVRGRIDWTSRVLPEWSVIEIPQGTVLEANEVLRLDPTIAHVEREVPIRPCTTPNDDYWPSQQPGFDLMKTSCAWDTRTHSNIVVAVLDDGVNYDHPDLFPNIWQNTAEVNGTLTKDDDGNGIVDDFYGASFLPATDPTFVREGDPKGNLAFNSASHGTEMASVMGAVGNNETAMFNSFLPGVFWTGTMLPVQIFSNTNTTGFAGFRGMEYAYNMGARIMNCSFEMYATAVPDTNWMQQFMLATPDVLYVGAAGNYGQDLDAPGALKRFPAMCTADNLIVVGNSSLLDERYGDDDVEFDGSNWGAISVDVFATGELWNFGTNPETQPFGNQASSSNAAAYTSGIAALVWSEYPTLTPVQLKQRLLDTADPRTALSGLCVTGKRINAAAAIGTSSCP